MNLNFLELIESIEKELSFKYTGKAIRYIDDKYDLAWSKAIDRFDLALSKAIETNNFSIAKVEGQIYRQTIFQLIDTYKKDHRGDHVDQFFTQVFKKNATQPSEGDKK